MQSDPITAFRFIFGLVFLIIVFAGIYLLKNFDRFFGADADMPSENSSARAYRRMQILVVWLHAVILSGAMALLMH